MTNDAPLPRWVEVKNVRGHVFLLDPIKESDKIELAKSTGLSVIPLYTEPQVPTKLITVGNVLEQAGYVKKKEWVGLTDEERAHCFDDVEFNKVDWCPDHAQYAKAIEAKLKEKNNAN
jgi:hypothetical protein